MIGLTRSAPGVDRVWFHLLYLYRRIAGKSGGYIGKNGETVIVGKKGGREGEDSGVERENKKGERVGENTL